MQRYDPATALVIVDVQNDFADPAGCLSVQGGEAVVQVIAGEIERATAGGALIVATQDWHPPHTPHFAQDGGIWPVHCVGGSWGSELHPSLPLPDDAPRIHKGANGEDGYSGFTMRDPVTGETEPTALDSILRAAHVHHVVITGLATDYCVQATALDAAAHRYETTVLLDAIAAVDLQPGDGDRAIEAMRAAGVVLTRSDADRAPAT